ncbi:MAG TPA: RecX family transcriptional regulator, partial [Candidatus Lustribacter sp.]|nr:RecX family transcriptional regulator [Candidatus Lustribacter sp.]
ATRGLARGALAAELRGRGVDPGIAHDALAVVGDADERARAEALVTKRLRAMHGLAPDVQARRLAGMLARKGYPTAIALAVVRDAIANAPEHRRD